MSLPPDSFPEDAGKAFARDFLKDSLKDSLKSPLKVSLKIFRIFPEEGPEEGSVHRPLADVSCMRRAGSMMSGFITQGSLQQGDIMICQGAWDLRKVPAMQKLSISFLGKDGPGVVATVSQGLSDNNCNILQVTQTILGAEFAAIFIVDVPDELSMEFLQQRLEDSLRTEGHDISVLIRQASHGAWSSRRKCEPYVITTDGEDGPGLISTMARVFARHNVNIENLKAVLGHGGENHALFVFEVEVPEDEDVGRLNREIQSAARSFNLNVSLQHRDIFEAMHRITDF